MLILHERSGPRSVSDLRQCKETNLSKVHKNDSDRINCLPKEAYNIDNGTLSSLFTLSVGI